MRYIKKISEMVSENVKETALKNCDNRGAEEIAKEIYGNVLIYAKKNRDKDSLTLPFEYGNRGYGIRPFGQGHEERERRGECWTTCTIEVAGKSYELSSDYSVEKICKAFIKLSESDPKMNVDVKNVGNYPDYYDVVKSVCIINNVSKEFTQLQKYLMKYANFDLKEDMCYFNDTSGKRGEYYESVSGRTYFCCNGKQCGDFLGKLKSVKSSRDTLSVEKVEDSDISDREYSRYYETECYGSVTNTIKVVVKTPSGRTKGEFTL